MQNLFTIHFESFTFLQSKRQAGFYNEGSNGFKTKKIVFFQKCNQIYPNLPSLSTISVKRAKSVLAVLYSQFRPSFPVACSDKSNNIGNENG